MMREAVGANIASASKPRNDTSIFDRSSVHVLVLDRDAKSRQEVLNLLRRCSYQVTAVETPRGALEVMTNGPSVDLLLAEVEFPKGKGLKMLRLVTKQDTFKQIPIVMMSTREEMSVVVKCLRLGAADYLVKPLRINELLNLWTHMWRRRRSLGATDPRLVVSLNMNDPLNDPLFLDASESNTGSTDLFSDSTGTDLRRSGGFPGNGDASIHDMHDARRSPMLELTLKPCVPEPSVKSQPADRKEKSHKQRPSGPGSAFLNYLMEARDSSKRDDVTPPMKCHTSRSKVGSDPDKDSPVKELLKETAAKTVVKVRVLTARGTEKEDQVKAHLSGKERMGPFLGLPDCRSSSLPAPFMKGIPVQRSEPKQKSLGREAEPQVSQPRLEKTMPWASVLPVKDSGHEQRSGSSGAVAGSTKPSPPREAPTALPNGHLLAAALQEQASPNQPMIDPSLLASLPWGRHAASLPFGPTGLPHPAQLAMSGVSLPAVMHIGEQQQAEGLAHQLGHGHGHGLLGHAGHFLPGFGVPGGSVIPPHFAAAAAAAMVAASSHLQSPVPGMPHAFGPPPVLPHVPDPSVLGLLPPGVPAGFPTQALAAAAAFGYLSPLAAAAAAAAAAGQQVAGLTGVSAPGLPPNPGTATGSSVVSPLPANMSWPALQTPDRAVEVTERREAALNKFRQKRKERCFEKKIRYASRKRLAEQRPRKRGQFVKQGSKGQVVKEEGEEDEEESYEDQESEEEQ